MLNWTLMESKISTTHLKWDVVKKLLEVLILGAYWVSILGIIWVVLTVYNEPYKAGFKVGEFTKGYKEAQK